MSISSIRMVPYLFFLGIIQIVVVWIGDGELLTSFAINKALLEVSRFYVMLSSAVLLFQTTSYAELTAAIRSFKTRRFPTFWNKGVEIFAFIIGVGYQMVPLLQREMQIIVQAQRAQGIGITEGSRLEQVRKLVRVGTPLFIRSLELVKNVGLAVINYSYSPLQPRSQYRELKFQLRDWIALAVLLGGAAFFLVVF